jgi:hypothetical protein
MATSFNSRKAMDPDLKIPQELYASEISFIVSAVWDNGFDIALGWDGNFVATGHADSYIDACRWLRTAACRHFPESSFAKRHAGIRLFGRGE